MKALVLILSMLAASPALAQDANALVEQGLALRREGRDGEAAERFRAAFAIDHSGRSLAQLALAEQAGGEWVSAERDLVAAIAIAEPWITEHRGVLDTALTTIRSHLGRLHVVSNAPSGHVLVDGREVATLPMEPISAVVGTLVVSIEAPGYRSVERTVTVNAGAMSRLSVDLVPEAHAIDEPEQQDVGHHDEPAPVPDSGPSPLLVAGLVGIGVTVLALGGTLAAVGIREDNVQHWNDDARCPPTLPEGRMQTCADVWSTFRTAEDAAIALGVVTGVLAVASAVSIGIGASEGSPSTALRIGPAYAGLDVRY